MLHWSLMLVMIALTCWAAGWTPKSAAGKAVGKEAGEADKPLVTPLHEVLFIGLLTELMLLFSPVTHLHYFLLWIPLVMALLMWDRERRGWQDILSGTRLVQEDEADKTLAQLVSEAGA